MAVALVQKTSQQLFNGVTSTSRTITGVSAGNLVVCLITTASAPTTSPPPALPTPSGWTVAEAPEGPTAPGRDDAYRPVNAIFYKANASSGSHTADFSGAAALPTDTYGAITLFEVSGCDTTSPLDVHGSTSTLDAAGSGSTPSVTNTVADAIAFVIAHPDSQSVSSMSFPPSSGYTDSDHSTNNVSDVSYDFGYKILSATGSQSASWTWTGTAHYQGSIAIFKAAAGGSTTTLTADTASITESAKDANLVRGLSLLASPATVTETANAATLARSLPLTAGTATFTDTTSNASLVRALSLGASSAQLNLAVSSAGLQYARIFAAAGASLALTENAAGLFYNRAVIADSAAIALGASDTSFPRTRIYAADTAVFAETVGDAGLYRNRAVAADTDAITLTGVSTQLIYTYPPLVAGVASFTETANDAGLYRNPAVTADTNILSLSIRDTGAPATIMSADTASFALTDNDATLARSRLFASDGASIAETVADAGLVRGLALPADADEIAVTGQDADFVRALVLAADVASYVESVSLAGNSNERIMAAGTAGVAAAVADAGLLKAGVFAADAASFSATASDASFMKVRPMQADGMSFSANWHANALLVARSMPADGMSFSQGVNSAVDPPILTRTFLAADFALTMQDGAFGRALRLVIEPFALAFSEYSQDYTLFAEPADYLFAPRNAGLGQMLRMDAGTAMVGLQARIANLVRNLRLKADVNTIRLNAPPGTTFMTANGAVFSAAIQDARLSKFRTFMTQTASFVEQAKDANLVRSLRLVAGGNSFILNAIPEGPSNLYNGTMFETDFGAESDTLGIAVVTQVLVAMS